MPRTAAVMLLLISALAVSAAPGRELTSSETRMLLARIESLRNRCSQGHIVVAQGFGQAPIISPVETKQTVSEFWTDKGRSHVKQQIENYEGGVHSQEQFADRSAFYTLDRNNWKLTVQSNSIRLNGLTSGSVQNASEVMLGPLGTDPERLGDRITAYDKGDGYSLVGADTPQETNTLVVKKSLAPISWVLSGIDVKGRRYSYVHQYSAYTNVEGVECATREGDTQYSGISFRPPAEADLRVPLDSIKVFQVDQERSKVTLTAEDVRNRLGGHELTVPNLLVVAEQEAKAMKSAHLEVGKRNIARTRDAIKRDKQPPILEMVGGLILLVALVISAIRALRADRPAVG